MMSENRHVAFDTDLCRANPEAAADKISELEAALAAAARLRQRDAEHPDQTSPMTVGPEATLCSDCPPAGYPTDKTRCVPCPRRISDAEAARRAKRNAEIAERY